MGYQFFLTPTRGEKRMSSLLSILQAKLATSSNPRLSCKENDGPEIPGESLLLPDAALERQIKGCLDQLPPQPEPVFASDAFFWGVKECVREVSQQFLNSDHPSGLGF